MTNHYCFQQPDSDQLAGVAVQGGLLDVEDVACPVESWHRPGRRLWHELVVEVSHNKREETIIWALGDCVIHERLLAEFERQQFTGYRLQPATVRFRNGAISKDYRQLVVTGWAGVARAESGIRLDKVCTGCSFKRYSQLVDPQQVVDWSQWTGEDFFIVWPAPRHLQITDRVAGFLKASAQRSFRLTTWADELKGVRLGFGVGKLSGYLPEDLALKYGRPLGLE